MVSLFLAVCKSLPVVPGPASQWPGVQDMDHHYALLILCEMIESGLPKVSGSQWPLLLSWGFPSCPSETQCLTWPLLILTAMIHILLPTTVIYHCLPLHGKTYPQTLC